MRAYIAGPMAGHDGFNYQAFYGAEAALDLAGWRVVNPARLDGDFTVREGVDDVKATVTPLARAAFLKRDFEWLAKCDAIFMLPGWESSTGANAELFVAHVTGLDVFVLEWTGSWWEWSEAPVLRPLWGAIAKHVVDVQVEKARR